MLLVIYQVHLPWFKKWYTWTATVAKVRWCCLKLFHFRNSLDWEQNGAIHKKFQIKTGLFSLGDVCLEFYVVSLLQTPQAMLY